MTTELEALLAEATARPWKASSRNWRNEEVANDFYIVGDIHEAFDEDSDDHEDNFGSSCAVAIAVGTQTSGDIPKANATLITIAVNHFERLVRALEALADKVNATSDCDHKRQSCEKAGCIGFQVNAAHELLADIAAAKGTS